MKVKFLFAALFAALVLNACKSDEPNMNAPLPAPSINTGIYGSVIERYGNWMPVVNPDDTTHGERPIIREIYVYEYTKIQEFDKVYYTLYPINKMPHKLVAKTKSLANGFFEIELKPGTYSVFLLEEGQLYANGGDGYGGINPVIVIADSTKYVRLLLDHGVD